MRHFTISTVAAAIGFAGAQNLSLLLSNTTELSTLATILQPYPDLVNTLASATNVTLFAPNNAAFSALNASGALSSVSSSFIASLIDYHVVQGTVYASQIVSTPQFVHSSLNATEYTNVTGGQVIEARTNGSSVVLTSGLKQTAMVVQANVNYTGGVVHIIDQVLTIPPTISVTALDAGLSELAGALSLADLTTALDGLKDVTVFAPSNSAFQSIGSALGSLSVDQLTSILEYHVINGTVAYSSALKNQSIPTLGGGSVNVSIGADGAVFVNQARVINADILVANGVVHVLDSVLNPNGTPATPPNGTSTASAAYSGASSVSDLALLTSTLATPSTTIAALTSSNAAVASTPAASTSGVSGNAQSSSSTAGALPMATAAVAGAMVVGGWAALLLQM